MNHYIDLAVELGLGMRDLQLLIELAPKRYKQFEIEKHSGGTRTIAQPARELKALQRLIIDKHLNGFPVHTAATAYKQGANIAANAAAHANSTAILKFDFESFFNSIFFKDWGNFLRKQDIDAEYKRFLRDIAPALFWGRGTTKPVCLSIGAPSSPILSNIMLYDLDANITEFAGAHDVSYTRYADDITFSGRDKIALLQCEKHLRRRLSQVQSPKLTINEEKRGLYTKGQRRIVTGLMITPSGAVSLGRKRKRMISSMIHKFENNMLTSEDTQRLRGFIGFAIACEAEFVERMKKKYGETTIKRLKSYKPPNDEN